MLFILIPHNSYALKNYRVQPLHIYITYTAYTAVSLLSTKKWNVCFAFATYCMYILYVALCGRLAQGHSTDCSAAPPKTKKRS